VSEVSTHYIILILAVRQHYMQHVTYLMNTETLHTEENSRTVRCRV